MSTRLVVVLCVTVVVVGLGLLFAVFFGVQTAAVILVKRKAAVSPEMSMVPQPLVSPSASEASGKRFSCFGYEFELPWADVTVDVKESSVRIAAKSGKTVFFPDPAKQVDILEEVTPQDADSRDAVVALFGEGRYDFYSDMLNATPDQLSVFMPREESIRVSVLLSMKGVLVPVTGPPSGIFAFAHGDFRGFQFGDPAVADKVFVELFHQDRPPFQVVFLGGQDPRARLCQDDINRLTTTLKPADESGAQ